MALQETAEDIMDKLWFYDNILYFEPKIVTLQSVLTKSQIVSKSKLQLSSNDKKPQNLNIAVGQPLFQLHTQVMSKTRPHLTSTSMNIESPRYKNNSKRKARILNSYKSLSELEKYEIKGFMDMGFTFPRDKLSKDMTSMIPGLQRLGETGATEIEDEKEVKRPYLSEAWLVDSPDSPFFSLRNLSMTHDGEDTRKHIIRYWARRVAMLVNDEH